MTTIRNNEPTGESPVRSERFTLRFDEDLHQLVLRDEQLNANGKVLGGMDIPFTKVSDNTDGPPWPE